MLLLYVQKKVVIDPQEGTQMFKTYRFKATKHLWEMYRDVCKKGAAHDWL